MLVFRSRLAIQLLAYVRHCHRPDRKKMSSAGAQAAIHHSSGDTIRPALHRQRRYFDCCYFSYQRYDLLVYDGLRLSVI